MAQRTMINIEVDYDTDEIRVNVDERRHSTYELTKRTASGTEYLNTPKLAEAMEDIIGLIQEFAEGGKLPYINLMTIDEGEGRTRTSW